MPGRSHCNTSDNHHSLSAMTLITMHSRIHFASNILEEALRAEIDDRRPMAPVLIYPDALEESEFLSRVEEGLMSCKRVHRCIIAPEQTKYETAELVVAYANQHPVDLIIAIGSAEAVIHGRKCRHAIGLSRYAATTWPERGVLQYQELGPEFFIIPGITGLPDPCLDTTGKRRLKSTPPTVIICDPTVIEKAQEAELARTIVQTIGRCMTVLTADTFNPLADGLAIDALTRIQSGKDRRNPRDLMAAMLNGAIAQQKGPGLVEAFGYSFVKATGRPVDSALLHRVLLARMLASEKSSNHEVIGRVLGLPKEIQLSDFIDNFWQGFKLPDNLRDIGMAWEEVSDTLALMERRFGAPQIGSSSEVRQMLADAY